MSHFDWYSGSYRGDHRPVGDAVCETFGASLLAPISRGRHGWENKARFGSDDVHCVMQWGGDVRGDLVHVEFTGRGSDAGAHLLRQLAPGHRVSRVDVAEDYIGENTFAQLRQLSEQVAKRHRVSRSRIVPDDNVKGETIYIGSRESPVFVRIYEKGKQVSSEVERGAVRVDPDALGVDLHGYPLHQWVRCEVEVKPKAHARDSLATAPAESFWGCSQWAAELHRELGGAQVERINVGSVYQTDSLDRLVHSMLNQYGNTLVRLHQAAGSWCGVGELLGRELVQLRNPKPRNGH